MIPIKLNLATIEYQHRRLARYLLSGAAVLAVLLSVWGVYIWIFNLRTVADFESRIQQTQRKLNQSEQKPSEPKMVVGREEIEARYRDAIFVNQVITSAVFPWTKVLEAFEKHLPPEIVLRKFSPTSHFNKVVIQGQAASMPHISSFLKNIEALDLFEKIVLVNLSVDQKANQAKSVGREQGILFDVECVLRLTNILDPQVYGSLSYSIQQAAEKK